MEDRDEFQIANFKFQMQGDFGEMGATYFLDHAFGYYSGQHYVAGVALTRR